MYQFPALFYGTSVILNNKIKFDCNEILTGYLNSDTDGFREMLKQLNRNLDKLTMDTDMDYSFAEQRYDEVVYETQTIMSKLDRIWTSLPPYSLLLSKSEKSKKRLIACMKKHSNLFESEDENSAEKIDFDNHEYQYAETKYGYIEFHSNGHIHVNLKHFQPTRFLDEYMDKMDDVQLLLSDMYAFNNDLENVFYWYINWINSVLRVKDAYAPLLQDFIHVRHGYLTDTEQAEQIAAFLMKTKKESPLQTQKLVAASQFSLFIHRKILLRFFVKDMNLVIWMISCIWISSPDWRKIIFLRNVPIVESGSCFVLVTTQITVIILYQISLIVPVAIPAPVKNTMTNAKLIQSGKPTIGHIKLINLQSGI